MLLALSLDYKKAPLKIRSAFLLNMKKILVYYDEIKLHIDVKSMMILSTCNRTEIYVIMNNDDDLGKLIDWWQYKNKRYKLKDYIIVRKNLLVIKYFMRLASGLESMILGEPQILGQLKNAYSFAMKSKVLKGSLMRLCQKTFFVAKNIRSQTYIAKCPVSVACSTVSFAQDIFNSLNSKIVLVIGAGVTAKLLVKHLFTCTPYKIIIANRTYEKARDIVNNYKATFCSLSNIEDAISESDIIISAISSNKNFKLRKEMFSGKEKIFIDLSVPSIIPPGLNLFKNVMTYYIDDIQYVIKKNNNLKADMLNTINKIINKGILEYLDRERIINASETIKAVRDKTKNIVDNQLGVFSRKIDNGEDPKLVLQHFAHSLKNKWLHYPSVSIRKATISGRNDMLYYAEEIFGLGMKDI